MSKAKVRTRFAPSPTGYVHIGNIRSAIFPYLIAKNAGGKFILRIEDTDRARFVADAEKVLEDVMLWLGLQWDEGPVVGGPFAPYHQTERQDIYIKWAQKLIDKGLAYADPYSAEELQKMREEADANKRPFVYREHRPENPPEWKVGMPLRFKQTDLKSWHWHDAVMGDLSAGPEALDDFILIKSDGLPTYNFAHIVDDAEMETTHTTRGVEYVSSTPNYLALYEALELTPPIFVSFPHILRPDGKKKLGKRDGAKSVTEYREEGYLPEAMLNFLATLGWNDGTEQEIFTMAELMDKFEIGRIQRSGARFDENKLIWMNGQWIRRLPVEELYTQSEGFWPASSGTWVGPDLPAYKKQILGLMQDRLKTLGDLRTGTDYFFADPAVDLQMMTGDKKLKSFSEAELADLLQRTVTKLNDTEWTSEKIQDSLNELLVETGKKPVQLFSLIRIALTFAPFSPALNETMVVLGKNVVLARLNRAIEALTSD